MQKFQKGTATCLWLLTNHKRLPKSKIPSATLCTTNPEFWTRQFDKPIPSSILPNKISLGLGLFAMSIAGQSKTHVNLNLSHCRKGLVFAPLTDGSNNRIFLILMTKIPAVHKNDWTLRCLWGDSTHKLGWIRIQSPPLHDYWLLPRSIVVQQLFVGKQLLASLSNYITPGIFTVRNQYY